RLVMASLTTFGLFAGLPAGAAQPENAELKRGPIVNVAADGIVGCLIPPFSVDGTHSKEELTAALQQTVDHYAAAEVPYLFLNVCYMRAACPSEVWDTYWDVENLDTNATGWPRGYWLMHKQGVDPFAVCVARCRQQGISPWLSLRMNDTHYLDDPAKSSRFWQQHPELRRADNSGFDFSQEPVRDHYLALVAELLEHYDCDGIELDWMRFPAHFKTGQETQGRDHLNEFMRRVRELASRATEKRGHRVRIAARIPAVPEFARGLGMDGVTWAQEGLVDLLILASVWRPSDTDIPIERWRDLIGPAAETTWLAAGTDLWLQGTAGGKLMSDDLETQRGFTTAMLDRGADLIYLFNHFNRNDFNRVSRTPDGREAKRNDHQDLLRIAGRMEAARSGPRRHVVTFHDPAAPNIANPRQLPAALVEGKIASIRVYTGPKPESGRVVIRVGLNHAPDVDDVQLAVQLNDISCRTLEDLENANERESYRHDPHRVFHVADLAHRMAQFEAPVEALQRGYNQVTVRLETGHDQQIIWLEIYVIP
ncbi:MAG: hypothetical protein ACC645_10750, partial [Pirellulales bacterium]